MELRDEILKILNSEVSDLKEGSDGSYEQVKAIDECDFNDVAERLIKLFSIQPVIKCEHDYEEIMYGSNGVLLKCRKCGHKS